MRDIFEIIYDPTLSYVHRLEAVAQAACDIYDGCWEAACKAGCDPYDANHVADSAYEFFWRKAELALAETKQDDAVCGVVCFDGQATALKKPVESKDTLFPDL